ASSAANRNRYCLRFMTLTRIISEDADERFSVRLPVLVEAGGGGAYFNAHVVAEKERRSRAGQRLGAATCRHARLIGSSQGHPFRNTCASASSDEKVA